MEILATVCSAAGHKNNILAVFLNWLFEMDTHGMNVLIARIS
jgi:hypothetical protein